MKPKKWNFRKASSIAAYVALTSPERCFNVHRKFLSILLNILLKFWLRGHLLSYGTYIMCYAFVIKDECYAFVIKYQYADLVNVEVFFALFRLSKVSS